MAAYFCADLHLGDETILDRRLQFESVAVHDQAIVSRWNEQVVPADTVFVLGDVAASIAHLERVACLNGVNHLILGNRDRLPVAAYARFFASVTSVLEIDSPGIGRVVLSHVPVHPGQLGTRWTANIHGHLHSRVVIDPVSGLHDRRYACASADAIGFRPATAVEMFARRIASIERPVIEPAPARLAPAPRFIDRLGAAHA